MLSDSLVEVGTVSLGITPAHALTGLVMFALLSGLFRSFATRVPSHDGAVFVTDFESRRDNAVFPVAQLFTDAPNSFSLLTL